MGLSGYYYYVDEAGFRQIKDGYEPVFTRPILLSLDEYWEVLHYIFCGTTKNGAAPWGFVVPLRVENHIRDILATAHFLYPEQIQMARDALFSITEEDFIAMYDFKKLKKKRIIRNHLANKEREI